MSVRPVSAPPRRPPGQAPNTGRQSLEQRARPQSAAGQRPLSARLDESVKLQQKGLAATLLTHAREQLDPRLSPELRFPEAAVMHVAPGARMLPCKSAACCWRWAASKLIGECQAASNTAAYFRQVLDEELGDSALQKCLDLEAAYEALEGKLQVVQRQVDAERTARIEVEELMEQMKETTAKAIEEKEEAMKAKVAAENESSHLEVKLKKATAELQGMAALTPEMLTKKLAEAEEKLVKVEEDYQEQLLKAKLNADELHEVNITQKLKLRELQALEAELEKRRRRKHRKKGKK